MKKKLALLLAVCLVVLSLCACGGTEGSDSEGGASSNVADTGIFTVAVPDGWMACPQTDMFGEQDADGNYPIDDSSYGLIKGGESEYDAYSKPTVYIYYEDSSADDMASTDSMWYESCETSTIKVNGVDCILDTCTDSLDWVHGIVYIPISDSTCFMVNIPLDMAGEGGVAIEDADVQTILTSITLK